MADDLRPSRATPTRARLLASRAHASSGAGRLTAIPGQVPDLRERPAGCPFHPRCPHAQERLHRQVRPPRERVVDEHFTRVPLLAGAGSLMALLEVTRAAQGATSCAPAPARGRSSWRPTTSRSPSSGARRSRSWARAARARRRSAAACCGWRSRPAARWRSPGRPSPGSRREALRAPAPRDADGLPGSAGLAEPAPHGRRAGGRAAAGCTGSSARTSCAPSSSSCSPSSGSGRSTSTAIPTSSPAASSSASASRVRSPRGPSWSSSTSRPRRSTSRCRRRSSTCCATSSASASSPSCSSRTTWPWSTCWPTGSR